MKTWNHRVVRILEEDGPMLHLKEVHYDEADNPVAYGNVFMMSEDMDGLRLLVARLFAALGKPILDETEITKGKAQ